MSGYFRRIAKLARPVTPGHNRPSPFGPPKPPVSQPVRPPTEAAPDVALTPSPEVAAPASGIAPSSLTPETASRQTSRHPQAESGVVTASTRQATDVASPTQPPVSSDQNEPRSIGDVFASDLSRMALASRGSDELDVAAQLPQSREPEPSSPVVTRNVGPARTRAPDPFKSSPEPRQPQPDAPDAPDGPDAPVAQARPNSAARDHPVSISSLVAPASQHNEATAPVDDAHLKSKPQRVLIRAEQSPAVSESWPDTLLRRPAPPAPPDEPAVAAALQGPRARPDVEVSIGAVNLSTEPPRESPKPAPQARPPRAAHSASGIWSGNRAFARSYLRRG